MTEASAKPARILHLDCFSGASGNMFLGALIDLGVPAQQIQQVLARIGVPDLRMEVSRVQRGSISALYVTFSGSQWDAAERGYGAIRVRLEQAPIAPPIRERALAVFGRLARAEARIHGVAIDAVRFHEIGSVDTLGDIVAGCAALELLHVAHVSASAVALGHGCIDTAHGRLPHPAPATLELLQGIPTYPAGVDWETLTPTGAALLASFVDQFGPMPALVPLAQGFGAGEDRGVEHMNVLRAVVGTRTPRLEHETVSVLETNLDDMNPEHLGYLVEELMRSGALDVSLSPLSMKKGRPGQLLRVITWPRDRNRLASRILEESSALGVRYQEVPRLRLVRESREVSTRFGQIRVKIAFAPRGERRISPEYEDCARAARQHEVPLSLVYEEATRIAQRDRA